MRGSWAWMVWMWLIPLAAGAADWPPPKKLTADVQAFWKKQKAGETVDFVKALGTCQAVALGDVPSRGNKPPRGKACSVEVDLYFEHGYRYDVLRATRVFYVNRAFWTVQPGISERAWKEGGVPAPTPEEALSLAKEFIEKQSGSALQKIELIEMGIPRHDQNVYRVSLALDLALAGQPPRAIDRFPFFLESDGEGWRASADLDQLPPQP